MAVSLNSSMLLALHLGRLKDQHRLRPEQVRVGKLNNVREAIAIARECRTILGGTVLPGRLDQRRVRPRLRRVLAR